MTTFADEVSASAVVRQLLEEYLIVCGTLIPGVKSLYRWQEKIEESCEVVALLKTDQDAVDQCMVRLLAFHPYELPEIVQLNPNAVSEHYADWLRDALRNPSQHDN